MVRYLLAGINVTAKGARPPTTLMSSMSDSWSGVLDVVLSRRPRGSQPLVCGKIIGKDNVQRNCPSAKNLGKPRDIIA
jgi:hypothetical protein